ncbi:MAG: NAD(P)-dependent oxidoreductase [Gammaproteobacteria bacterium]|nr:MAG: NAD(P)-dependent oxidoreductase [Gammaproteobacteria bacterium]
MNELKVGFIGLGAMGVSMAGHLKRAGLLAGVANRSAAKAQAFAAEHGVTAATPAELAKTCNTIVLCVSADADVLGVTREIAAQAQPGTIVIDHSTVSSTTAKEAQQLMRAAAGDFLDAPVSGGVEGAKNGKLSIMVGGDADALARVRPVLDAYAARVSHMGGIGAGQNTKAVNQVLIAGIMHGMGEGLALAEALGLDPAVLMSTLTSGAATSWYLEKRGASALRNEFNVGFKLALMHKDLGIGRDLAAAAGTVHEMIDKTLADYAKLMAQGHGDEDVSAMIRLKRANR